MNYYTIENTDNYGINIFGEIINFKTNRKLKYQKNEFGYLTIMLLVNGKQKKHKVHRLIAIQFVPNIFNYTEINHINGIKTDNRIDNLEWCTRSYNVKHAWDNGLMKHGGRKRKFDDKTVLKVKLLRESGYKIHEIANLLNVSRCLIGNCLYKY